MDTIKLPNGSTAIDFTPKDSKDKAIVHLHVIKRLAKLLPKADQREVVEELISELNARDNPTTCLSEAVDICNEFTSFHETVNLIEQYEPDKATEGRYWREYVAPDESATNAH